MAKFGLRVVTFEGVRTNNPERLTRLEASSGYVILEVYGVQTITCIECGLTSANVNDVEQRYCGRCCKFHDDTGSQK